MRRAVAALAAAVAAATLAGCETTQQESARIARRLGHQTADPGTTRAGRASRDVRVLRAAIVPGSPAAVALELVNGGAAAQAAIPVLIDVRDAAGAVVYRNDTRGIESSLQQLALLPAHATAWWVDNEILAGGGTPSSVTTRIGAAGAEPRGAPRITTGAVSASDAFPGPHVEVTVRNGGTSARSELAVYAVALRAGRVVGAGRALVAALPAHASAAVLIPMTGTVTGASVSITAAG